MKARGFSGRMVVEEGNDKYTMTRYCYRKQRGKIVRNFGK